MLGRLFDNVFGVTGIEHLPSDLGGAVIGAVMFVVLLYVICKIAEFFNIK